MIIGDEPPNGNVKPGMSVKRKARKIEIMSSDSEPEDGGDEILNDSESESMSEAEDTNGSDSSKRGAAAEAYASASGRDADFSQLSADGQADGGGNEGSGSSDEVEKLRAENDENRAKYLRALADLENFRKRAVKERSELLKYQGERIFVDLLDVVDNFELALQHAEADPAKLKDGVELIYKMLGDVLSKWEVRADSGMGKSFDPNRHSAISRLPSADEQPGTIIGELKKAYFYKDRLIRAGEVVVATEPEQGQEASQEQPKEDSEGKE